MPVHRKGALAVACMGTLAALSFAPGGSALSVGTATPSATAFTETCPSTAPSGGPYTAGTWAALHPHILTYSSGTAQTILASAGDPTIAQKIDPITGGGACASVSSTDQGAGVATYRLPASTGYTLLGAPDVTANPTVTGKFAFIAARLWDVDPSTNTETLVTRGLYRINSSPPNSRPSSCIRERGGSHPATSRSWSCWARTRLTRAPPTGRSRSRSAVSS